MQSSGLSPNPKAKSIYHPKLTPPNEANLQLAEQNRAATF